MKTIRLSQKTGKDGVLSLAIPLDRPECEYEVVVVLEAKPPGVPQEQRGWPPGYFDKTFGSIDDDSFARQPQGELPDATGWD